MGKKTQVKKIKKTKKMQTLPVIQPDAAGIDIGATEIYVAVPHDRSYPAVRSFDTFTHDLTETAEWLKSCGIKTIAMESTGVYWIPVFQILEAHGFDVALVNAHHVKNVPGRKTDVQDCQWLQYLHSVGLLRGSYRPSQEVCAIRSLLRHRDNMVRVSASHVQHMQKAITQMNLQIHNVISDITGVTGLNILSAIVDGERSPKKLAAMSDPRIKADEKTIIKSLQGDYRPEHVFTLKQALQIYRHYRQMIGECDSEIEKHLREFESRINIDPTNSADKTKTTEAQSTQQPSKSEFDLRTEFVRILGTDLTQIDGVGALIVNQLFSEIGPDVSKFPTVKHFCSWLGLCPNNKISGGRILSSKTRRGLNRAAQALRMAAQSLWHSKSYLGHYFKRMRARHGAPKAITATAHKLARIIYHLIKMGKPFNETVFSKQEKLHKMRLERNLKKQANLLGFQLVPIAATP